MKLEWRQVCQALALLWPLAGHAVPVDIPELGVRIATLPPAATALKVTDQLDSYSASFQVGDVHAQIVRMLDSVPAGANLADRSYRSSIQEYFEDHLRYSKELPTSIAGLAAWSMCGAQAQPDSRVSWHCKYYVVSDQHLYTLSIYADSPSKPPEFDTVVEALYRISFEPVRTPTGADGRPVALPRAPAFRLTPKASADWYPYRARARGEQGVVDFDFSLDKKGRAQNPQVLFASAAEFASEVPGFLNTFVARVPPGWGADGSETLRFTAEIQFLQAPCSPASTRIEGASLFTVCTSRTPAR